MRVKDDFDGKLVDAVASRLDVERATAYILRHMFEKDGEYIQALQDNLLGRIDHEETFVSAAENIAATIEEEYLHE